MAMQSLRILVTHQDGRVEDLSLETEKAVIGSGAHCEVRLPVDQAAAEHVLVRVTPAGATVEARTYQPAPLLNGSPFSRAQLLPDSVIGVGSVKIQVWVVDTAAAGQQATKKDAQKISPVGMLALVLAVPAVVFFIYATNRGGQTRLGGAAPRQVPELWDTVVDTCPQTGKAEALDVAQRTYALAQSRAERRPFRLREGVAAVPLFEQAGACFSVAGQAEAAKVMNAEAEKLRSELSEDYRTHRARMEHALDVQDYLTIRKEVSVLLDMTASKEGEYVAYLSSLERQLSLRFGKAR